jgi:hypothetical protein
MVSKTVNPVARMKRQVKNAANVPIHVAGMKKNAPEAMSANPIKIPPL